MIKNELVDKYFEHLIHARRKDCFDIVVRLLENKIPVETIYTELFQRSLYKVGEYWEKNLIFSSHRTHGNCPHRKHDDKIATQNFQHRTYRKESRYCLCSQRISSGWRKNDRRYFQYLETKDRIHTNLVKTLFSLQFTQTEI